MSAELSAPDGLFVVAPNITFLLLSSLLTSEKTSQTLGKGLILRISP